jgi:tryptophan synthase beta chain
MVREFQSVIGDEARSRCLALTGRLPDVVVACVGGGSNAMGLFDAFVGDAGVRLIGIEAGGEAILAGRHAARFAGGSPGILQGTRTFVLQDPAGNIMRTHSVSAGLDYAAVGPEHAWLRESGRAGYLHVSDDEALAAFEGLARDEGILPALDKDVQTVARVLAARGVAVPEGVVDATDAANGPAASASPADGAPRHVSTPAGAEPATSDRAPGRLRQGDR